MENQEMTPEHHHHHRSLSLAVNFLDAYQPLSEDKASLVSQLRDRVRTNPSRQDVLNLANALDNTEFKLRRGTVKTLPGLAKRIRDAAQTVG